MRVMSRKIGIISAILVMLLAFAGCAGMGNNNAETVREIRGTAMEMLKTVKEHRRDSSLMVTMYEEMLDNMSTMGTSTIWQNVRAEPGLV